MNINYSPASKAQSFTDPVKGEQHLPLKDGLNSMEKSDTDEEDLTSVTLMENSEVEVEACDRDDEEFEFERVVMPEPFANSFPRVEANLAADSHRETSGDEIEEYGKLEKESLERCSVEATCQFESCVC